MLFISLLSLSCKETGRNSNTTHSDPILQAIRQAKDTANSDDVYIDTLINNDRLKVVLDRDTALIHFNGVLTKVLVYCDHTDKEPISIYKKYVATNLILSGSIGAIGFSNYQDEFARSTFFLFKVINKKIVFLDIGNDHLIPASAPVIHEKNGIYFIDGNHLLLLNYHSSREKKRKYYDSTRHYKGFIYSDERYYNFTRINLRNSSVLTFNIPGTGNEFAIDKDHEVMLNKAVRYGK